MKGSGPPYPVRFTELCGVSHQGSRLGMKRKPGFWNTTGLGQSSPWWATDQRRETCRGPAPPGPR